MNVLLTTLNSKYVHSNLALKYLYTAGTQFCSGLTIREFTINNSRDYVFDELVMGNYDAVCFSCYIWNIEKTLELAEDLKKARPDTRILFGGPEVSYDAPDFMEQHPFVDFLIAGEGENTFAAWCRAFEGEGDYGSIKGLFSRQEGGTVFAGPAAPVDFSGIPFPYGAFPCEEDRVIYYESSRGCPFNCSYCISSIDKRMRALSADRVKEDLSCFIDQKVKQVKFLDRTFNWDRQRSMEILNYIMEADRGITNFHFEICADLLNEELLSLIEKTRKGLFQFEIGIQSVNEKTLAAVNRSSSTERTLENIRKLVAMDSSHIHVDLIAGLPFEDYTSFVRSFDTVYSLGADNLQLGFLKLLKGTVLRDSAEDGDYVYMAKAPYQVISNKWMSAEDLCRLKQVETVMDLYHNRGGFAASLECGIRTMAQGAFAFFEKLADYYYCRGFQHRSHKKEDLYRIFYEFSHSAGLGSELELLLARDLEETMNFDAVKKFKRKGWNIL